MKVLASALAGQTVLPMLGMTAMRHEKLSLNMGSDGKNFPCLLCVIQHILKCADSSY